jgi:glycine cleavage system H protein
MTTRYTKSHEYVRVEGDVGVVGITDYAQTQLGDVVFVELPPVGAIKFDPDEDVTQGLSIGEGVETTLSGRQMGLRPVWSLVSSAERSEIA